MNFRLIVDSKMVNRTPKYMIGNSSNTYGLGSMALHWLMALGVLVMFPLGLYIESLGYYDPNYRIVPDWHKSIGLLLAALYVVRVAWRLLVKQPDPMSQPPLLEWAAKVAHGLLYVLMPLVFISGYLISTADGRGIEFFGWFEVPALPPLVDHQEDVAGAIHEFVTMSLIVITVIHALAALKHHFIDKDETLNRMLGKARR